MGLFSKDIQTMDDLLLHGLKDIYYAENRIVKSLPGMIDKSTNRDLTKGLRNHLEETNHQISRLDQVFQKLGQKPQGVIPISMKRRQQTVNCQPSRCERV
jgi:ferritin-like metal-binding protein YciE